MIKVKDFILNLVTCYDVFVSKLTTRLNAISTFKLAGLLSGAAVLLALLSSQFIEKSGDAVYKWGILRYYVEYARWYPQHFDHHQGRWALNLPVIALMKLFGTSAYVYYVYPMLCGIAGSLLVFKISSKASTRLAGLAAFIIYFIFPLTVRGLNQFLPMLPAAVFILAAIYFMGQWLNHNKKLYIVAAALMLLLAYGCKITSLYWALAFALFIALFCKQKPLLKFFRLRLTPSLLLFSGIILVGLITETVLLNHYCNISGGRLEIISSTHMQQPENLKNYNFFAWLFSFLRPLSLRGKYFESFPCFFIFLLGLASSVLCLNSNCIYKKFLAFTTITVYLLHCYMVSKIFPFVYPEMALSRYFTVVAILCIILYCASNSQWHTVFKSKLPNFRYPRLLMFLLVMAWLIPSLIYIGNSYLRNGTLLTVRRAEKILSEANAKSMPVMCVLDKKATAGKLYSGDRKNILRWLTCFNKTEYIPRLADIKFPLAVDAGKKIHVVINNADKISSSPQDIVVIDYNNISIVKKAVKKTGQTVILQIDK